MSTPAPGFGIPWSPLKMGKTLIANRGMLTKQKVKRSYDVYEVKAWIDGHLKQCIGFNWSVVRSSLYGVKCLIPLLLKLKESMILSMSLYRSEMQTSWNTSREQSTKSSNKGTLTCLFLCIKL